jgi:broad specificity phosphatase PhoE
MSQTVTRWWWIRHAPVVGAKGRIYGQDDLEADCSHLPTFRRLADALPYPALWLASHLRRTHQTLGAIQQAAGRKPIEPIVTADLAEQHFGDWQGLTYAELECQRDGAYHRFWHAPASERPPNGESFDDVVRRVEAAIGRFTREHAGRDIVAISHGGAIRAALAATLAIEPERALGFEIDTCSITRIDHIDGAAEGAAWRVVAVNQHPNALGR